ncbi:MAG TPA: hypothetical protein VFY44_12075 [Thermoleophilaceae bacterium]|nr:hypothetical protein [Thermoleophilaceae bacterium]
MLGLSACGGDDGGSDDKGSGDSAASTPSKAASPSHAAVLKCLQDAGLEAEDQSNSSGKKVGIDYPAGRLVISFEKSAEDAETYASVAKTNGEGTIVKGTIVATIPVDAEAQSAEDTVEGCI